MPPTNTTPPNTTNANNNLWSDVFEAEIAHDRDNNKIAISAESLLHDITPERGASVLVSRARQLLDIRSPELTNTLRTVAAEAYQNRPNSRLLIRKNSDDSFDIFTLRSSRLRDRLTNQNRLSVNINGQRFVVTSRAPVRIAAPEANRSQNVEGRRQHRHATQHQGGGRQRSEGTYRPPAPLYQPPAATINSDDDDALSVSSDAAVNGREEEWEDDAPAYFNPAPFRQRAEPAQANGLPRTTREPEGAIYTPRTQPTSAQVRPDPPAAHRPTAVTCSKEPKGSVSSIRALIKITNISNDNQDLRP